MYKMLDVGAVRFVNSRGTGRTNVRKKPEDVHTNTCPQHMCSYTVLEDLYSRNTDKRPHMQAVGFTHGTTGGVGHSTHVMNYSTHSYLPTGDH